MAQVISIGSGKGGIGKSMISANLATLLAKRGKRVVLIDLDTGGADAHIMFGHLKPTYTLTDFLTNRVESLADVAETLKNFHGLKLIVGTGETLHSSNMPWMTKQKLLRHISSLDSDYVLIDVGAGTSLNTLDFFLHADHHLCIASNDPTSVLDLYRFIKLAVLRRALSSFLAHDEVSKVLVREDFSCIDDIYAYAERIEPAAGLKAKASVAGFHPGLIINMAQKDRISNLVRLQNLIKEYVGVSIPVYGSIPEDPQVRESIRRLQPIVAHAPESAASVALNELVDRLLGCYGTAAVTFREPVRLASAG